MADGKETLNKTVDMQDKANQIIGLLKVAPESQLDPTMKLLVDKWSDPPTPLEVLEVLDKSVRYALATQIVVVALGILFDLLCASNGVSQEEVVNSATWREKEEPDSTQLN